MTGVFDDHLTVDTVVAFADGEMALVPYQRAGAHVMRCPFCAAEVAEQSATAAYLRQAALPRMPGSLFDALRSIPVALPQQGPTAGISPDDEDTAAGRGGQALSAIEHSPVGRGRRFRLGAGSLMAGLAVGAVVVAAAGDQPTAPIHPDLRDATAVSRPTAALHPVAVDVLSRRTTRHR